MSKPKRTYNLDSPVNTSLRLEFAVYNHPDPKPGKTVPQKQSRGNFSPDLIDRLIKRIKEE